MTLREAKNLAIELMTEHGLSYDGWYFKFTHGRKQAGICVWDKSQYNEVGYIGLSKYLIPHMTDEAIEDTILHEIAHAMVGYEHGHNHVWQRQARAIGCNGQRCYEIDELIDHEALATKSKYTLTCPTCGRKSAAHRKLKRSKACGKCCNGYYDPKHKMILTQNY